MKKETMLLIIGVSILVSGFSMGFYGRLTGLGIFFGFGVLLILIGTAPTVAGIVAKSEVRKNSPKSDLGLGLVIVGGVLLFLAFLAFYFSELVF